MEKNILLIKGGGIYQVLEKYIEEFGNAFRELGYNTITMVLNRDSYMEDLKMVLDNYDIYATIDCFCAQKKLGMSRLYPKDVVQMTYLCDHPLHVVPQDIQQEPEYVVTCFDRNHVDFFKRTFPGFERVEYIPLSGNGADTCQKYEDRNIEVIFTGTYMIPEAPAREPLAGDGFEVEFRYKVQQKLIEVPSLTVEEAVKEILKDYPIDISWEEFVGIVFEVRDIEQYIRYYFRDKIVRSILAAGIKLTVFGSGWEKLQCEGIENLTIMSGDIEVARQALGEAKIALNIMPWIKDGFQERIAAGMLSEAVVFTDTSKYVEEEFSDGENIMFYHLEDIDSLPQRMLEILKDSKRAKMIARNGKQIIEEKHTWRHRVIRMAELIEEAHERMKK